MLTSAISSSAVSATSAASTTSVISMTTWTGLPEYGVLAVIALILLLSAKEILSASKKWDSALNCSLNMGIAPLLVAFTAIVVFKVAEIV
ncbi:hypothetical protein EFE42_00720 [Methanohalophilus sp. RSK]|uniref:hypothetical protein n=1 Tax=Methanohalophilus sp. RSK TaxID=2485783 RepID=UPI000F4392AD|nr:hypothetical protein [Methanohalophilus sp. RSK]RNI15799.1 hypothetical protein EFE42_00720 [Methanohalophilus sp. RSK]